MYKYKDTTLQFNRRVTDSITDIYGVGFGRASHVCELLGLGKSLYINSVNRYFYELIANILKFNYFLDDRLINFLMQRLVFFVENRRLAGVRRGKGLPNRGQRTQSNRKTALRLKPNLIRRTDLFSQPEPHSKSKNNKNKGQKVSNNVISKPKGKKK